MLKGDFKCCLLSFYSVASKVNLDLLLGGIMSAKKTKVKLLKTLNDLPADTRVKMVTLLNDRLADTVDLHWQLKQAHWNVKGSNFISLHQLFDSVSSQVLGHADIIAERVVQIGGAAMGTVRISATQSTLKEYPLNATSGAQHVKAVSEKLASYGKLVRKAIEDADDAEDAVTADIFTGIAGEIDKQLWFVEAHSG